MQYPKFLEVTVLICLLFGSCLATDDPKQKEFVLRLQKRTRWCRLPFGAIQQPDMDAEWTYSKVKQVDVHKNKFGLYEWDDKLVVEASKDNHWEGYTGGFKKKPRVTFILKKSPRSRSPK